MLLDSEADILSKPLAGGSSPRCTNLPSCICSKRERFRVGTPSATTMGSATFELLLPPAREDMIAGRECHGDTAETRTEELGLW